MFQPAGLKVSDIGELLEERLRRWGAPVAIVCDRWREAELREARAKNEYPCCPVVVRGMGFLDVRPGRARVPRRVS